jgi:hypothetical protein
VPILAPDELYAGRLVAAVERKHPRDLFDVWQLYESGGIGDGMVLAVDRLAWLPFPADATEASSGGQRRLDRDPRLCYVASFCAIAEE